MREGPSSPSQQVTVALRHVCAETHGALVWLRERLAQGDARPWLDRIRGDDAAAGVPENTVRDAVRRAAAFAAGDSAALAGADLDLLDRIWDTLAATGTHPVADACRAACVALERDLGAAAVAPPLRVGRFALMGVIGSGGSGTVYRAAHVDNGKVAAVKVLHPGLVDAEIAVRFRNEARIAGRLGHPAIVQLLDSGVHQHGGSSLPYVAYEFVDGLPFDRALAGHAVASILQTFAQLCDGVQHAHDAQVLHRDLKPANVLVDAAGCPRVLDFGIACSLVPAGERGFRTISGQVLGTPGFMSPEQAAGKKTDVRGDVWSLGAMLFHALLGQTPHDVAGLGVAEALARVAGQEPRRARSLRADLDRDVAAVVDKAIASDPALRYASVAELGRDVRRLLAGEPVDARPPSTWQVLRLLARRHRFGTFVTLAMFASFAVGGVVTAVLWQQAAASEERAVRLSAEALAAATGGMDMASQLAETTGAAEQQLKLVLPMLEAVTSLRSATGADSPRWRSVESKLREVAGDLFLRREDFVAARAQRTRVLAIEAELSAAGGGLPADRARAMVKLGDLDSSPLREESERWYGQAHAILLSVADGPSPTVRALDDLSWSYGRLAGNARIRGQTERAAALAHEHLTLARRLIAMSPDALRNYNLATALLHLRACEDRVDSATDADLAELAEARAAAEAAVAADPGRRAYLIAAFQCNTSVTRLHLLRAEPQEAMTPAERAAYFAERFWTSGVDTEVLAIQSVATRRLAEVATSLFTAPPPRGNREAARRLLARAEERLQQDRDPLSAQVVAAAKELLAEGR